MAKLIPVLFVAVAVVWFGEPVVLGGSQAVAAPPVLTMREPAVADAPKVEASKAAPKAKGKAKGKAARVKPLKLEPLVWAPIEPIKVPRFEPLVVPKLEPMRLPELRRIEPRFEPLALSDRTAPAEGRGSAGRAPCTIGDGYQTVRFSDGSVYSGTFKGCEPQPGPAEYHQGTVVIRGVAEPLSSSMVRLRSETAAVTIRLEIVTR